MLVDSVVFDHGIGLNNFIKVYLRYKKYKDTKQGSIRNPFSADAPYLTPSLGRILGCLIFSLLNNRGSHPVHKVQLKIEYNQPSSHSSSVCLPHNYFIPYKLFSPHLNEKTDITNKNQKTSMHWNVD